MPESNRPIALLDPGVHRDDVEELLQSFKLVENTPHGGFDIGSRW